MSTNAKGNAEAIAGLSIALIFIVLLFSRACSSTGADKSSNGTSGDRAAMLVEQCAAEAGIPRNVPGHRITPSEMKRLTACIDRNK